MGDHLSVTSNRIVLRYVTECEPPPLPYVTNCNATGNPLPPYERYVIYGRPLTTFLITRPGVYNTLLLSVIVVK